MFEARISLPRIVPHQDSSLLLSPSEPILLLASLITLLFSRPLFPALSFPVHPPLLPILSHTNSPRLQRLHKPLPLLDLLTRILDHALQDN